MCPFLKRELVTQEEGERKPALRLFLNSNNQQPLIVMEPLPPALEIRYYFSDIPPELFRMVRLADMNQFMHHDVIENLRRCLDQAPAEVKPSLVGA